MFDITAIPALQDNYIWAIHDDRHVVVVDPGDATPVLAFLDAQGLRLDAILCTHRHHDHIGGIAELREVYNV
ncbi:MAG TPA: MBL fold metallo-hydrolase, partial [Gallionella sp.]|nr:MBL fold metallo-hydrolase [Gallionella sp.]